MAGCEDGGTRSPLPSPIETLEDLDLSPVNGSLDPASVDDYIKRNQESIAKSEESVKALQETMKSLLDQTSARKTDLEGRKQRLRNLKQEVEEISLEDIAKEERELEKLVQETGALTVQQLSHSDEAMVERLLDLQKGVELYKKNMGLEVRTNTGGSSENTITFVYTKIDPACHDTEHTLTLVAESQGYKYVNSVPSIPDVENLFKELNSAESGHFAKFLSKIREQFIKQTNKEN